MLIKDQEKPHDTDFGLLSGISYLIIKGYDLQNKYGGIYTSWQEKTGVIRQSVIMRRSMIFPREQSGTATEGTPDPTKKLERSARKAGRRNNRLQSNKRVEVMRLNSVRASP